ncbi:hypothetical protein ENBRE01_2117, partial [Enteropsectra breve]
MKFWQAVVQVAAASFRLKEFPCPISQHTSITLKSQGHVEEGFLLSELFLSEVLRNIISANYENISHFAQGGSAQALTERANNTLSQMRWICRLADCYLRALSDVPYKKDDSPESFTQTINHYVSGDATGALLSTSPSGDAFPVIDLKLDRDPRLIKLILQMRHKLFAKPDFEINQAILLDILTCYEELRFRRYSLADIFIQDIETMEDSHLRIKCDIVFGINLYCWLLREGFIDDFKTQIFSNEQDNSNKQKDEIFEAVRATIRLDCFYFIEPLFNLINVSSNEVSFSINFVDALKDLRYKWEHGDQVVLCTQECGSGTKPISFLELCNMGNYYCKRITRLIAVVPEVPVEGIATAFCDILMFLPQIKELDLVNYGYVEYVDRRSGNVAYSDVILHSLITHHRIPMSRLTGFIALGYYNPSERTIMELRQFKFEKFGMHGMHYGGDPIVLRQLFEEKDIKNVITYHRNYEIRDGPAFNEYNNLRESVTHFVAAEELMKVAMKRGFIKNIQVATVYQYSNNNFTDAYESILDGSKKPKKRKANTHTAMEGPLGLGTMRVFAEPDILEEVICALKAKDDGGFKMPRPLSAAKESQYRVSKLVVLNSA